MEAGKDDDDDDVPDLVENFDEASKNETNVVEEKVEEVESCADAPCCKPKEGTYY